MDNLLTWIKMCFGALCGLLSFAFGGLDSLLCTLLVCIIIDYVTGVLAALYQGRLNSETGFLGILKKVVILLIVVLAHMIENAAALTGVRDMVIGFYIANEGISIIENAGKMNVPVAKTMSKFLEQLKENNDK
ncbi:MAG: phage holin family protein [Clostridia bacterium]|nr:phage holin family protein [Clostridia bacterium]